MQKHIDIQDPTASSRKRDHIELAFKSQVSAGQLDPRFLYEPLLSGGPEQVKLPSFSLPSVHNGSNLKTMHAPIWVSSMTGGTEWAAIINRNLAKACKQFKMGMGLGSCRGLLYSDDTLSDFAVRKYIGDDQLLYANLGIAQVEEIVLSKKYDILNDLVKKLDADGLIIHVNPLQEWTQPEGDKIKLAPIDTIKYVLDACEFPVIVKEVGQGMGPKSLSALLDLPLAAIDFAASGGTNFAKLELLRDDEFARETKGPVVALGHTATEMTRWINSLSEAIEAVDKKVIISGGIKDYLDGYYHLRLSKLPAAYGQASSFLRHARGSYEELEKFVAAQIEGLKLAYAYLDVRE